MKMLVVTEKCDPRGGQRDGGARVIDSLKQVLGANLKIMQFGPTSDKNVSWCFDYPFDHPNRFEKRVINGDFIAKKIQEVESQFTHIIFIHASMQFGLTHYPLRKDLIVWTFPMFLTPSYKASGEVVPSIYFEKEKEALSFSTYILTPSHLERKQLIEIYGVDEKKIALVPRGVDTALLSPEKRKITGPLKFCTIGSIKRQKNILELISLFHKITDALPNSSLKMIGPIQDEDYGMHVMDKIEELNLQNQIELTGHIPPSQLGKELKGMHIHLSTTLCETFGRSIFETLSSGLPNIVMKGENAATEFLQHLPYIHFFSSHEEVIEVIRTFSANYSTLSSMSLEIGKLYDDKILSRLLAATICKKEPLAVCDFDGTLFHKDDPEKTHRCMEAFKKFPKRAICSARFPKDLLERIKPYDLQVDWIIGGSGSIITDGSGTALWTHLLTQTSGAADQLPEVLGLRREVYQGVAFINPWEASKLHAVNRLLREIEWEGQVKVFGDGPYDLELITYFGGTLINSHTEVYHDSYTL